MCGIAGILNFNGQSPSVIQLKKMSELLIHRGPDGDGIYHDQEIGIVHRRLAIIDLHIRANQPMKDRDTGCVISLNGEIFNYKYLRNELAQVGASFATSSDTEVLLKGLIIYGTRFLSKVNGDFAFSFWNPKDKILILGRDRFGVKPLYYYIDHDKFIFSSEIKPILAVGVSVSPVKTAIESYFSLRYARGEQTIFNGIKKIPPATVVSINLSKEIFFEKFWDLKNVSLKSYNYSEAVDQFSNLFRKSVKDRLESDVKIGAFLSGGVDSSSVVSEMITLGMKHIDTFTYNTKDKNNDLKHASQFARRLGLCHHTLTHSDDDIRYSEIAQYYLEEPIGDSIVIPWYRLSELSQKYTKVVLTGEGADELLLGYAHQDVLLKASVLKNNTSKHLLRFLLKLIEHSPIFFLRHLSPYPEPVSHKMVDRLIGLLNSENKMANKYLFVSELHTREEREKLLTSEYLVNSNSVLEFNEEWFNSNSNLSELKQLLLFDLNFWLTDYGLLRIDKLSMSHGLEVRVPFLDHNMAEFIFSLNEEHLFNFKLRKRILRSYAENKSELTHSESYRKKHPFYLPIEKVYAQKFYQYAKSILTTKNIEKYGIMNASEINSFLSALSNDFISYKKLVSIVHFQNWCDLFLDSRWKDYN